MREQAIQFGEGRRLVGVLTHPDTPDRHRPAVIIPNTGIEHRVGPNRLHVQLCRAFADAGFAALRMDVSGMGDSRPPAAGGGDSVSDLRIALDELTRLGVAQRFLTIGLCSGGHDAHLLSLADPRVVAGAYLDHYYYPTPRFHAIYWMERLGDWRRVRDYLKRKWSAPTGKDAFRGDLVEYFAQPDRARFAADLDAFMARDMALFFLYTGELQYLYNYREQLTDAFPHLRHYARLALHYMPEADHTFSRAPMRENLIRLLLDWATRTLPPIQRD